jgi:hypothetical protein
MHKHKRIGLLHFLFFLLLATSHSCGSSGSGNDAAIDMGPFIIQARNAQCSDIKNKLYLIDNTSVLWDRAGNCPDNSYSQTLYGKQISQVLCRRFDSIAGPQTIYNDQGYKDLFDTMIANLDKPDLGLGPEHSVVPVSVRTTCTANSGCMPKEYCAKAVGDCGGAGSCVPRPEVCALAPVSIGDLVCGCDGNTYGHYINACDAAMQGVNIAHTGACP